MRRSSVSGLGQLMNGTPLFFFLYLFDWSTINFYRFKENYVLFLSNYLFLLVFTLKTALCPLVVLVCVCRIEENCHDLWKIYRLLHTYNITFVTMFLKAWNEVQKMTKAERLFHSLAYLATKLSIFIFVSVGLDLSKWVALTLFRDHIQLVPWPCAFFSYAAIV